MKILYITYDGLTDNLGQSQILPYLEGLAAKGHQITILSCEKRGNFSARRQWTQEALHRAGMRWVPLRYHKRPPVLSSVLDVASLYRKAKQLHGRESFDLVHCRSYLSSLVGLRLKRKAGLPFLFDMRGFWADERIDGGLWNLKNPLYLAIYKFFKRMEKRFLGESDAVISLTEAGKRELLRMYPDQEGCLERKITVIPCCVDVDSFSHQSGQKERAKEQLGIGPDELVCAYLGSLGTWYRLDAMMDFFARLNRNSRFLVITPDGEEKVLEAARKRGVSPKRLVVRSATRGEVPGLLAAADFGLFFITPSFSKISSSATKLGELLAAGKPVIANTGIGDQEELFERNRIGTLVREFSDAEYNRAIATLPALLSLSPDGIRQAAAREFSLANGLERYHHLYERVSRNGFDSAPEVPDGGRNVGC